MHDCASLIAWQIWGNGAQHLLLSGRNTDAGNSGKVIIMPATSTGLSKTLVSRGMHVTGCIVAGLCQMRLPLPSHMHSRCC